MHQYKNVYRIETFILFSIKTQTIPYSRDSEKLLFNVYIIGGKHRSTIRKYKQHEGPEKQVQTKNNKLSENEISHGRQRLLKVVENVIYSFVFSRGTFSIGIYR